VYRVHLDTAFAEDARQRATGHHVDRVGEGVGHLRCRVLCGAVIASARHLVYRLVQAAAQGHVGLLKSAADGEKRYAQREGAGNQRKGPAVAIRIQGQCGIEDVLAEMPGMHVRRRTGQQHTVGHFEKAVDLIGLGARHDQGQAPREPHRVGVLAAGDVKRMPVQHRIAGGYEHDRIAAHQCFLTRLV
jgi:hypothetical protein